MKNSCTECTLSQVNESLIKVLSYALFKREKVKVNNIDIIALLEEARAQSVFGLVFAAVKSDIDLLLTKEQSEHYNNIYMSQLILNVQNHENHTEIDSLMNKAGIPYCIIKGVASASFYPEPTLRTMGDIDFIVKENDIEAARKAIEAAGYTTDQTDFTGIHINYTRKPFGALELHRKVNGIPDGELGKEILIDISRLYDTAVELKDIAHCFIPNKYYHGLIILLHTVSHITREGVGLRHLCDWAVFVNSLNVGEFEALFEDKLKNYGLWRFSQMFTLVCTEYLGVKRQAWSEELYNDKDITREDVEALLNDILRGGNFGTKDMNRYREIKYISGGQKSVDNSGIASQMFKSLNRKVYANYKIIDKNRILLPVGWAIEAVKYSILLVSGKRKTSGTIDMLKEADERKGLYNKMRLFEI